MNPFSLQQKRYLVTGASSGIGREAAAWVARMGGQVVLSGRNITALEATRAALEGEGHSVAPVDLASDVDLAAWVRGLAKAHGPLDGLVHSAGLHSVRPLQVLSRDHVRELFEVNVVAATQLIRGFRNKQSRAPRGSVVLVSSVAGLVGQAGVSAYSSTKGALVSLTQSLALELAKEGVRVNCVAPGVVATEMTSSLEETVGPDAWAAIEAMHPLGLGEPADVAAAICFLLSEASRWVTGTTLVVDGGYTAH